MTGHGNNGTNVGATFTVDREMNPGSALLFSGGNYVQLPDLLFLDEESATTIAGWVRVGDQSLTNDRFIIGSGDGRSGEDPFTISVRPFSGNWLARVTDTDNDVLLRNDTPGFVVPSSRYGWVHFAQVLRADPVASTLLFYIDGALVSETTVPNIEIPIRYDRNMTTRIGMLHTHTNSSFVGEIDDVRFYNRSLSESEISSLYTVESPPVNFYMNDPVSFEARMPGNLFVGTEDFEEASIAQSTGLTSPLEQGVANTTAFPNGLSMPIEISTNSSLFVIPPGHAGEPIQSNVVITGGLDVNPLVFTLPADLRAKGISFDLVQYTDPGDITVSVFDVSGAVIGSAVVTGTPEGSNTLSIAANGDKLIGHFEFATSFTGSNNVGADNIRIYADVPFIQPDLIVSGLGGDIYGSGAGQTKTLISKKGRRVRATVGVGNDGEVPDAFRLSASKGNSLFKVAYASSRSGNVTAALIAGTHQTSAADPGMEADRISVSITPNKRKLKTIIRRGGRNITRYKRKRFTSTFKATSLTQEDRTDSGVIKVKTK